MNYQNLHLITQNKSLNNILLIAQNEDSSPIEPLLRNLIQHHLIDITPLELIKILRWSVSHKVSANTNTLILNNLLQKIDDDLMPEFLKLHNDYQDTCLEMWKHKIETDFNPSYWLTAAQCLPTKIDSMATWLIPISTIKPSQRQYQISVKVPQLWPSKECWRLIENTLQPAVFKNLVNFVYYVAVTNSYQKKKGENYAIGYACSKILTRLSNSKMCKDLITTLIRSNPDKFKGKTLVIDGLNAIELLSKENPIWAQQYGVVILNTFLALAIKEGLAETMDAAEIDNVLQNLLEQDIVPLENTSMWWDARFKNNSIKIRGIKVNPVKWNIPETDKIKWMEKLLKPALEKQNGLKILKTLLDYKYMFPQLATTCFDLMSEKQWQDCKHEWSLGTVNSLKIQLTWLHVNHPRIKEWKNSKIGKKILCATLLHYITEFKITQSTGVKDWKSIQPLIEHPTYYFSDKETISILPAPFNTLEAWLPQHIELYKKLSFKLLTPINEQINIDKLMTVVSSFCSELLGEEINASALIQIRENIDPGMDFISLLSQLQKNEEIYKLPKSTFDNEGLTS